MAAHEPERDGMLVCWNGHVITDLLRARPDLRMARCDRCGAGTLHRCPTCGCELPGANRVPGFEPVGTRPVPAECPGCGVPFPWAGRVVAEWNEPLEQVVAMLRRLPLVARQLRWRHGARPAFAVRDDRDLEDLVRSLLPLHFDDVRPAARTPRYEAGNRTDFVLAAHQLAVTVHLMTIGMTEADVNRRWAEDSESFEGRLVFFVYDPERRLPVPERLQAQWSREEERLLVTCVIAGFAP
ncbi:MAG TPA: DUF2321 domain-containing protein [Gemmataceae bacterium]|nr:DUF2321 domain-containing protein [Gemmataceae bacterium]